MDTSHIPVLKNEVLHYIQPKSGGTYVDGTFGNGGYSAAVLDACDCNIIAFDRDERVFQKAEEFKKKYGKRFTFFHDTFSNMHSVMERKELLGVNGVMLDIGVSSMQIDDGDRGFSFRFDAPLNMGMGKNKFNAFDVINNFDEVEIANILFKYGDVSQSRIIAKTVIKRRLECQIGTTFALVDIIKDLFGEWHSSKITPKVFQAIRIFVNDELGELERVLFDMENILGSGGRLVVVDFHSLEDRIVKNFIKQNTMAPKSTSRYLPIDNREIKIGWRLVEKNAIMPTEEEVKANPRARSAKLRVVEKI